MNQDARKTRGIVKEIFSVFASLKLAVFIMVSLAIALAVATILESKFDTPTAQYWVYRSIWFYGILALLGVNIFAVMVDRLPWKPRHTPFLLAHIGILMLLAGSWLTQKYGLDGNLRVSEGETNSVVEMDSPLLVLSEGMQVRTVPIRWQPPGVAFSPISLKDLGIPYDLTIDQFISRADSVFNFVPQSAPAEPGSATASPAVKLKIVGGPMRISQDVWLWTGDPSTMAMRAGPAWLSLTTAVDGASKPKDEAHSQPMQGPQLYLKVEKEGALSYRAVSSDGKEVKGRFEKGKIEGQVIQPGWKGGVALTVAEFIPDATVQTTYKQARVQYGPQAPPSAIHLVAGSGKDAADIWLGLGSRAVFRIDGRQVDVGYFNHRVILPFGVKLERFTVEHYVGSQRPASFSSNVTIQGKDADPSQVHTISMNQPLDFGGVRLYQASYEEAMPRPTTSIFSVNNDPGRVWKYLGSLLIVFGSILLFAMKYRRKKTASAAGIVAQTAKKPMLAEEGSS